MKGCYDFKKILNKNKKIIKNFGYLSVLRIIDLVLPLVSIPYLTRTIGVEKFGLISFASVTIAYLVLIVDFGFGFSAAREISINRKNKEKVAEIFSATIFIKLFLMLFSIIILLSLVLFVKKFNDDYIIYLFSFGLVIGNVFFPVWFFQGMEKMKFITIFKFISKLVFIFSIFIFIKNENDFIFVPLINSLGEIVAGVFSMIIIFLKFKIKFILPNKFILLREFKKSYHIFISKISTSIYTTSNIFILGLFTNNTTVAYYAGGEKIVKAIQGFYSPISQAVYPHISKLSSRSRIKTILFLKKLIVYQGIFTFFISLFTFVLAPFIVNILLGEDFSPSIKVVRILSFLPFIISLSNVFGVQTMLNFQFKKEFAKIISSMSLLHIFLIFLLIRFDYIGISFAVLITETLITISMFLFLKRKGINLINFLRV